MNSAWTFLLTATTLLAPGDATVAEAPKPGALIETPNDCPCFETPGACMMGAAPCPCVWASVDALFWQRQPRLRDQAIVIDDNDGSTLLSSENIEFDLDPGLRANFGVRCGSGYALEFDYLALFEASARDDIAARDPLMIVALPGDLGLASNVFYGADRIRMEYSSQLYGGEINISHCCCVCPCDDCCDQSFGDECGGSCGCGGSGGLGFRRPSSIEWLIGFRYLYLGEELDLLGERSETGGVETGVYEVSVDNHLYGAQIGGRLRGAFGCRLSWELTGKAGLFGNDARQRQSLIDYPDFYLRPPIGRSGGNVAFLGELGLSATYQLSTVWNVRAGYNLMWIEGVALAPDQLDFTFTPTSGSDLDSAGLFLHGVNVGLEARW